MYNLNENNISVRTESRQVTKNQMLAYSDLRICYIKNGSASWKTDRDTYNVAPGDIMLFSHKQKRVLYNLCNEGIDIFTICITRQAFLNTCYLPFFMNLAKADIFPIRNDALLDILKSIEKEYNGSHHNKFEMISAKLTEFFVLLERIYQPDDAHYVKVDKNMIKVLDFINENITEKITLKDAAHIANMAESSFSRHFCKVNGISFKKYVMTKKTEYAIHLLNTTDMNVIDVAFECGFSSISGFYDSFRKITGATPNKLNKLV